MGKKGIDTLWDDVRGWLTDATHTAIREAEDLSRRGRLKLDILNLSRGIEKQMAKLGGLIYGRHSSDSDTAGCLDADEKRVIREISRLEAELEEKEEEYEAERKRV